MRSRRGKRSLLTLAVAAVVLAGAVAAYRFLSKPAQPNVLVVLIDTLRADHLSMNGYARATSPVIDAFAQENLNFRRAITPAPWTPAAVASIFTGLYPSSHGMVPPNSRREALSASKALPEELLTLAELFQRNGYVTAAVSPNPWIKPEFGFASGFDSFVYLHREPAAQISRAARKFIDSWRREKPFFLYLHYLDPHDPYTPPAPYNEMFKDAPAGEEASQVVDAMRRYDGEIRYTDTEIGKLFAFLKERGLYDDLVIVVLADHGEQFMERGHQGHGYNVYNEETHVPLIIKAGKQRGDVGAVVSTLDVYPTLIELAGLHGAGNIEGFSLLSGLERRRSLGVLTEIKRVLNQKAYVNPEGLKLVMDFDMQQDLRLTLPAQAQRVQLFDSFAKDPRERAPLSDSAAAERMNAAFTRLYGGSLALYDGRGSEVEIDMKTVKELQSLGYM